MKTRVNLLCLLFICGCARLNRDLTHTLPYDAMVGKTYVTQEDFTIFKYRDSKTIMITYPDDSSRLFDSKILGVLPKGSELFLVKVIREGNFEIDYSVFYCQITASPDEAWIGKTVSPMGMESSDGQGLFESRYLEER